MQNLDLKVIYLTTGKHRRIRVAKCFCAGCRDQRLKWLAKNPSLFVSHDLPAAVRITHQARSVGNQNKALGVAQNVAREIAFSLQFRLIGLQATDVEHQAAVLRNPSLGGGNSKSVDQHMNGAPIFALEDSFAISESSLTLHLGK